MPDFLTANLADILNKNKILTEAGPSFKTQDLKDILARTKGTTAVSASTSKTDGSATLKSPSFKNTNLDIILNRKPDDSREASKEAGLVITSDEDENEVTILDPNLDWRQELDDRLAENEEATGSRRRSQAEVEKRFWNDFFATLWSKELIKPLQALGVQFKLDILKWGFDVQSNDILAFLQQEAIKTNILKNKLLKEKNYTVLHNAVIGGVATRQLRTTELTKQNTYNLIYNPNWYKLSPAEMTKYLELQQKVLSSSLPATQKAKANRLIFLVDPQIKKKVTNISDYVEEATKKIEQPGAKIPLMKITTPSPLNSFAEATRIAQGFNIVEKNYKSKIETEAERAKKAAAAATKNAKSISSTVSSVTDIHFVSEKLYEYTHELALLDFSADILSKYPKNKNEEVSNKTKIIINKIAQALQDQDKHFEIDFKALITLFTKKLKELANK